MGEFEWCTREEWMSLVCALYGVCIALVGLIGWVNSSKGGGGCHRS